MDPKAPLAGLQCEDLTIWCPCGVRLQVPVYSGVYRKVICGCDRTYTLDGRVPHDDRVQQIRIELDSQRWREATWTSSSSMLFSPLATRPPKSEP